MTKLKEIDIIKIFKRNFTTLPHILIGIKSKTGINEDCGVIDLGFDEQVLVVTTDLISKKRHAPPTMTYKQFGMKSITVNISDLAAMGAKPLGMVISLGLPDDLDEKKIDQLSQGMQLQTKKYGTCVFGGDVNKTDDLIIAGTALGITRKEYLMTRHGARIGDLVVVTGNIGLAASGLALLQEGNKELIKKYPYSISAILEPEAKIEFSLEIAKTNKISAVGDITDGLAWELHKIGAASNVGIEIREGALPIHSETKKIAEELNLEMNDLIMHVGEDFQLVFTIKENDLDLIAEIARKYDEKISVIGKVKKPSTGINLLKKNKETLILKEKGWDQFSSSILKK
ncbi:MAG: thiamine-phosphate kinase [Candidatus Helarchaeota archaeon]